MPDHPPIPDTPAALRRELEALHPDCFGWALACCGGDRTEAEDALHGSYVKVLDGRARFGGRSSFKTWLFGVIRRTAAERRRRRFWRRLLAIDDDGSKSVVDALIGSAPDPAARVDAGRRDAALRRALGRLSERQRQVLHLVFYQDLRIEDAAAVLELPVGTARTHYARGKARLRRLLEEMQPCMTTAI